LNYLLSIIHNSFKEIASSRNFGTRNDEIEQGIASPRFLLINIWDVGCPKDIRRPQVDETSELAMTAY